MGAQNENHSNKRTTKKKKRKKKNGFLKFLQVFILVGIILGLLGAGGAAFYVNSVVSKLPDIDPSRIPEMLEENSTIVDADGNILETIQKGGLRTIVRYQDISPHTINAFISIEDKTFWEHNGFNFIRLMGAVRDTVFSFGEKRLGGTSTITQQLARNIYLEDERSSRNVDRKIREAYYAIELEKSLTKKQIIEAYLNKIYLGANANGVQAAAKAYFNKDASELTLVESAMLAGIPKSPTSYAPLKTINKEDVEPDDYIIDDSNDLYTVIYKDNLDDEGNSTVRKRYEIVLYTMKLNGYITDAEYQEAMDTDIRTVLNPGKTSNTEITSYFADMVIDEVIADFMEQGYTKDEATRKLYTEGLTIYSTIDTDLQRVLENAYSNQDFTSFFGEPTHNAVKAFQKQNGLTADGIVGKGTIAKMGEMGLLDPSLFSLSSYRKGTEHEDVVLLKKALDGMGMLQYNDSFPKVTVSFDGEGNIISKESKRLLLHKYSNLVNELGQLVIPKSDYYYDDQGNLVLRSGRRLSIYPVRRDGEIVKIKIDVKSTFKYDEGSEANSKNKDGTWDIVGLYSYQGRDLLVPDEYKTMDDNGNAVIDKSLFDKYPDFFQESSNGDLVVDGENFVISKKGIVQPQSAMVIIDYRTGELKAIVGGRNVSGQKIYNRANNPRQPGSAIKPLSVYLPAIASGNWTAASVLDDVPTYLITDGPIKKIVNDVPELTPEEKAELRWPLNWYEKSKYYPKYFGLQTLRKGIEYSQNVITTKLLQEIGIETSVEYLEKFGISTIEKSDHDLGPLAMGGMTQGISPLELTEAFGAMANEGVRVSTYTYTKVVDHAGNVVMANNPEKTKVVDADASFIVQDMMRTGVQYGVASSAKIRTNNEGIPVAGKTGTTSNKLDAWFVGYTPYYAAGIWFGNDVNMPLSDGSAIAAKFWQNVMTQVHKDLPDKDFVEPDNLIKVTVDSISGKLPSELSALDSRNYTIISEYFIPGTEPTEVDDLHVMGTIDTESGKLATPYCPTTLIEDKVFVKRPIPYIPEDHLDSKGEIIYPGDWEFELPTEECDLHNVENIDMYIPQPVNGFLHPYSTLPDGSNIVNFAFDAILKDGSILELTPGTRILSNGISFPDGRFVFITEIQRFIVPEPRKVEPQPEVPTPAEPIPDTGVDTGVNTGTETDQPSGGN